MHHQIAGLHTWVLFGQVVGEGHIEVGEEARRVSVWNVFKPCGQEERRADELR